MEKQKKLTIAMFDYVCCVCGYWVHRGDSIDFQGGLVWCAACAGKPALRTVIDTGAANTKRCWTCRYMFTRADALRHGGNWNDNYCGC